MNPDKLWDACFLHHLNGHRLKSWNHISLGVRLFNSSLQIKLSLIALSLLGTFFLISGYNVPDQILHKFYTYIISMAFLSFWSRRLFCRMALVARSKERWLYSQGRFNLAYSRPPLPGSTDNAQSNVHVLNGNSVLTSDQLNTFDNISMWVMYGDLKSCNHSKTFWLICTTPWQGYR